MAKWWLGLSLLGLICLVLARLEFGEIHMLLSLQSLRIGISNDTEVPSPATASPTLLSSTTASPTLPLTPSPTLLLTLLSPTATNSPTSWSTCSREYYGDLLLTQWQSNRESYCQEPGSQFHCAKYLQYTRNKPDYVCEFRNGQFDQGKIHLGCKLNGKIREQHHVEHLSKVVSSKDDAKPASEIKYTGITSPQYLAFMDQVHITHRPTRLVGNHTGQWEELKQGETVIFVGRDCNGPPFNPWHCFASILDAYQTIVQFNLAYNATSFVFLDRAVPGPFHLMWQALGKQHLTQAEWSRLSQPLVVDHGILLQTESFICTFPTHTHTLAP
ncbi:hypothetical protein BASA81_005313 [Batrachochytrium salamandrivorans]|nr:hypothetical protein BASA81_005313 [Batrachochytrium salamandrivorans]